MLAFLVSGQITRMSQFAFTRFYVRPITKSGAE